MSRALVIGVVGAESTGKTALAQAIQQRWQALGHQVARVDETLRSFCNQHGRTPTPQEQWDIARAQTGAITAAAQRADLVIADTTALMTAVYSDYVFGDTSLYPEAEAAHRRCDLSLLTALDLPWIPDGLQRDGPQVRAPVDALVRASLQRSGVAYAVIAGEGEARNAAAMAAVQQLWHRLRTDPAEPAAAAAPRWHWHCERCGDTACERHLLLPQSSTPLS